MALMDVLEITNILRTLEKYQPDEIYNLAAQSFVALSFEQPILTADIDALGPLRVLECLRSLGATTRFYQASTSEMFGHVQETPQTESTPFYPRSPYGVAKVMVWPSGSIAVTPKFKGLPTATTWFEMGDMTGGVPACTVITTEVLLGPSISTA